VTMKTRLGKSMDSINFRDVVEESVSAGADCVMLHARTVKERYSGTPHYDLVEGFQKDVPVPLVVSGNIYTLDDAI
ncbi:MAG: tRNA-dihydrouridine synthase, partial [Candidatus Methanomethylophilaceae archaeon]|nr:tRNA-dihydrouridine synthase [Candidatus Methanomethylophilaceae archaeon]